LDLEGARKADDASAREVSSVQGSNRMGTYPITTMVDSVVWDELRKDIMQAWGISGEGYQRWVVLVGGLKGVSVRSVFTAKIAQGQGVASLL